MLHAAAAQTIMDRGSGMRRRTTEREALFLMVTEPRSGSDWLVDLLDAHPNVCVPAGAWPEKHSGEKHKRVEDSIANLDDVRAALRGTKWEI